VVGQGDDFEIIDGLVEKRTPYDALFAAPEVRICSSAETEAAGWAGVVREIRGETKPSDSRVEVLGVPDEDYAINVWSAERREPAWFPPHLLEPAD